MWFIHDPIVGSSPVTRVDDTQRHPLGLIAAGKDDSLGGGEFMYLQGVGSVEVGSAVVVGDLYVAKLAAANDVGQIGAAMAAVLANQFGWFQVQGRAAMKVATGFAINPPYLTSTAGTLDDAVVAGDRVKQATGRTAIGTPSAGLAYIELNRSHVDNGLAA